MQFSLSTHTTSLALGTHHEHNVTNEIMTFIFLLLLLPPLFLVLSTSSCTVLAVIVFVRYIVFLDGGIIINANPNPNGIGSRCIALSFQSLGSKDVIRMNDLFQYLSLAEVTTNAHRSSGAKCTAHGATNLRRYTERRSAALRTVVAHNDRFDDVAILQLNAQLGGCAIAAETTLDDLGCEGDKVIGWIREECQQRLGYGMNVLLGRSRRHLVGERSILIHRDAVGVGAALPSETNLLTPLVRRNELVQRRIVLTVQQLIELVDAIGLQLNASLCKGSFQQSPIKNWLRGERISRPLYLAARSGWRRGYHGYFTGYM